MKIAKTIIKETATLEGRPYSYFREDPKVGYADVQGLGTDVLLLDLQKLNIDNQESVRRFVEANGIPQFGIFGALFRASRVCDRRHPYPLPYIDAADTERDCEAILAAYDCQLGYLKTNNDWIAVTTFAISERIRRRNWMRDGEHLQGGIISVKEVQYLLRLLQNAAAIIAAHDYHGDDSDAVVEYLLDGNHPQSKMLSVESHTPVFLRDHIAPERNILSLAEIEDNIQRFVGDDPALAEERRRIYKEWKQKDISIAVDEAEDYIALLKTLFINPIPEGHGNVAIEKVNGALSGKSFTGAAVDDSTTMMLIEQFESTLGSDDPWHICENGRCKRLFKRQREYDPNNSQRFKPSKYCSNSCRVIAQRKAK